MTCKDCKNSRHCLEHDRMVPCIRFRPRPIDRLLMAACKWCIGSAFMLPVLRMLPIGDMVLVLLGAGCGFWCLAHRDYLREEGGEGEQRNTHACRS